MLIRNQLIGINATWKVFLFRHIKTCFDTWMFTLTRQPVYKSMKYIRKIILIIILMALITMGLGIWILFGSTTSNPCNYKSIGDIPTPWGYERISGDDPAYSEFLRKLPLKSKGSDVMLYTGGRSRFQSLNYAVVAVPLLSNAEQCADVCMRLRAEYLYHTGQFKHIHFQDVNGKTLTYSGGNSRKAFERYLKNLYGVASTISLSREMKTRRLAEMQPGDVFVYPARYGQKYGHAIIVVDVAINKSGEKAFLLAEGNTPAREIHIMRNFENPFHSPWFVLDHDADNLILSVFHYKATDLKHF